MVEGAEIGGQDAGDAPTTYSPASDQWQQKMDEKRLDAGWLGKFFGAGVSAPTNIAGSAVLGGLAIGAVVSAVLLYNSSGDTANATEIWKYMTPIITGALGYLFGKGQSAKA